MSRAQMHDADLESTGVFPVRPSCKLLHASQLGLPGSPVAEVLHTLYFAYKPGSQYAEPRGLKVRIKPGHAYLYRPGFLLTLGVRLIPGHSNFKRLIGDVFANLQWCLPYLARR